jgi:hypothetical protein
VGGESGAAKSLLARAEDMIDETRLPHPLLHQAAGKRLGEGQVWGQKLKKLKASKCLRQGYSSIGRAHHFGQSASKLSDLTGP